MAVQQTESTQRGKKFVKDLGIYAIGNIGSKLITFLLVPFYTHYITNTDDYGFYELALTISFCFIPLLCFQMTDGGFRLLIETKQEDRHRAIISFITKTLFTNIALIILLSTLFGIFHPVRFLGYIMAYGITQTIYEVAIQITRGLGKTKTFVAAGILNAFLTALFSIVLLAGCGMGVDGIFISAIAAKLISLIFINNRTHLISNYIRARYIQKPISRELLKYSVPLIPVAFCWWLISANNQFFIEHYLGLTETGYYGLICRLTGILYIITNIFYQTWQQNAIEQYNSPDRNKFFSMVFNNYIFLLCFLISILPFGLRINYFWLVGSEYQASSQYLFINSLYVLVFALAAFLEIGYQCAKRTARILPSLLIAIVCSVLFNFLLIKRFGVNGVILSSIITYAMLFVYRFIDTRKFIQLKFSASNILPLLLMTAAGILYYSTSSQMLDIIICCVIVVAFLLILPSNIKSAVASKLHR